MQPPTAASLNALSHKIIGGALAIHRTFGSGLLENAYLTCLCHELRLAGLEIETQRPLPLRYRGLTVDCAYRADVSVEGILLVEVKALDAYTDVHTRQLLTYLKLADCRLGLLLNFGAATMQEGIKRVVNDFPKA
jgi:GxxExxY protein